MNHHLDSAGQKQLVGLGRRLRRMRRDRLLSQAALARQLGFSAGSLRRMEKGCPGVTIGRWVAVLRHLNSAASVDAMLTAPGYQDAIKHQGHRRGMRLRCTGPLT